MKKGIILTLALLLFSAPIAFAGEIRVYDANDQFVGIYLGIWGGSGFSLDRGADIVYVPSLNAVVAFDAHDASDALLDKQIYSGTPNCNCNSVFYTECNNYLHLATHVFYISPCGKAYFLDPENELAVTLGSEFSQGGCATYPNPYTKNVCPLVEVQLPFTMPLALPVRTEYVTDLDQVRKGDLNYDGDVDGEDLEEFAEEFGD